MDEDDLLGGDLGEEQDLKRQLQRRGNSQGGGDHAGFKERRLDISQRIEVLIRGIEIRAGLVGIVLSIKGGLTKDILNTSKEIGIKVYKVVGAGV